MRDKITDSKNRACLFEFFTFIEMLYSLIHHFPHSFHYRSSRSKLPDVRNKCFF